MRDTQKTKQRLLSLDVFRGLIMILLAAKSCAVVAALKTLDTNNNFDIILQQFSHAKWAGFTFWDLVQPGFMFMAGAALFISCKRKFENGITWEQNLKSILFRSLKLFICGTALHCVYAGELVWELWNVLVQLAITTIISYLIINKSYSWQITFTFLLLLITEVMYRFIDIPNFNEAFVQGKNFGSYADWLMMGKINEGGWVAINFIPTAAHTIWGVLAGKLLISALDNRKKMTYLIVTGLVLLIAGYLLDILNVTPIIKRISTSSFVLVSGGWSLLIMALLFWINDIKKQAKYAWIITVVGMNAIFIYLFFETIGKQWFNGVVSIFVAGFLNLLQASPGIIAITSAFVTLFAEWYLCYWLYKRKIFFKL